MRISTYFGLVLLAVTFSTGLLASEPFHIMTCDKLWEGKLHVKTNTSTLTLHLQDEKYSAPLESCTFSSKQLGKFSCKSRDLSISNRFFVRHNYDVMQITATRDDGSIFQSPIYIVDRTNTEGFNHPSDCMVDNEYVYVE